MKFRIIRAGSLLLICSLLPAIAFTQSHPVKKELDSLQQKSYMKHASWGFFAKNLSSGKVTGKFDPKRALVPASIQKLLTTGTALRMLGGNFRYETPLTYSGTITKDSTLKGNIYIEGSGDPTLGSERFDNNPQRLTEKWLSMIREAGIRKIEGKIVGDNRLFGTAMVPRQWIWEDMGNYYGAGATALNFMENKYELVFNTGQKEGAPTELISISPDIPGIHFHNEIKTGAPGSGDQGYIFGSPYSVTRYLRGTLPPARKLFSIEGSMPDPALATAWFLHKQLKSAGISVSDSYTTTRMTRYQDKERKILGIIKSPELRRIITATNHESINLYAESLLKTIGEQKRDSGTTRQGIKAMKDYWEANTLKMPGTFLQDGSGLAPTNRITARSLTRFLAWMAEQPSSRAFLNSIPVAGKDGTVKYVGRNSSMEGRIHLKTGSMEGARSYAGYAKNADGEQIAFSFMINNYKGSSHRIRKAMNELLVLLTQ